MRSLLFGLMLSFFPLVLQADDMTIVNNGRYGPTPLSLAQGQESKIRMASETLRFDVGKTSTTVRAKFIFENTDKNNPIRQRTGFPDQFLASNKVPKSLTQKQESMLEEGFDYTPDIETYGFSGRMSNMRTMVNGKFIKSDIEYGFVKPTKPGYWEPGTPADLPMAWHVVDISIPAGGQLVLERKYSVQNSPYVGGLGANVFDYIVHSGASWFGPIGELNAIVFLKDGLTTQDLLWPGDVDPYTWTCLPEKSEWKIIDNTHLDLSWRNFDPEKLKGRQIIRIATKWDLPNLSEQ